MFPARCGDEIKRVLTLDTAFPMEERIGLEVIIARDSARNARMLQSFTGGIVDFPVYGTSDPYVAGWKTMKKGERALLSVKSEYEVIERIDRAVKTMNKEEVARLTIQP